MNTCAVAKERLREKRLQVHAPIFSYLACFALLNDAAAAICYLFYDREASRYCVAMMDMRCTIVYV